MIEVRPFAKLGGADHGWLKAKHHFSFARYYDPDRLGWGAIRVWNDDEIAPNTGSISSPLLAVISLRIASCNLATFSAEAEPPVATATS